MESITLNAKKRELTGRKVAQLREESLIPAEMYGKGLDNQTIAFDYVEFEKVFEKAGESSLIDVVIDGGEPVKSIVQSVQRDPVSDRFIHVDFKLINLKEKITPEVPLVFKGVAPAEKDLGGVFVSSRETVQVKVLPLDLIHEIEVDITGLATFEDKIYVKDLQVSDKVEIMTDPSLMVAAVEPPRKEEDLDAPVSEEEEKAAIEALGGEEGEAAEGDAKADDKAEEKKEEKSEEKKEG